MEWEKWENSTPLVCLTFTCTKATNVQGWGRRFSRHFCNNKTNGLRSWLMTDHHRNCSGFWRSITDWASLSRRTTISWFSTSISRQWVRVPKHSQRKSRILITRGLTRLPTEFTSMKTIHYWGDNRMSVKMWNNWIKLRLLWVGWRKPWMWMLQ